MHSMCMRYYYSYNIPYFIKAINSILIKIKEIVIKIIIIFIVLCSSDSQ